MYKRLVRGELKDFQTEKRYVETSGNTIWARLIKLTASIGASLLDSETRNLNAAFADADVAMYRDKARSKAR